MQERSGDSPRFRIERLEERIAPGLLNGPNLHVKEKVIVDETDLGPVVVSGDAYVHLKVPLHHPEKLLP